MNRFKVIQQETKKEAVQIKKHFFEKKIRVLGISGSMRSVNDYAQEQSNSEWLLGKCLEEAKKQGAETEKLILREYNIEPCRACYSTINTQCHYPCSCYPKGKEGDDMTNILYDKVMWADVIIFATPVNNFKMSSMMSLFIDRLISLDGSLSPANKENPKDKILNIKHTKFIEATATTEFGSGFLKRMTGKVAGIIVTGHEVGASMVISSLYMTLNHYGMLFPPYSNMYAVNTVCDGTYKDKKILTSPCYEKEAKILAKNVIIAAKIAKSNSSYWWQYDSGAD
ncbi:MAG: flavodoxin family protein [Candidatus Woesearchaeota archaeon]|jgi:multimeric flavodoxin WrbA